LNRNLIIIAVVVIAIIAGAVLFLGGQSLGPSVSPTPTGTVQEQLSPTDAVMKEEGQATDEAMMEKEVSIDIANFAFLPKTMTLKKGATVTWINQDTVAHTATADDASFDTGLLAKGESGSVTFDKPGTYSYHCTPHPNMKATIVVE